MTLFSQFPQNNIISKKYFWSWKVWGGGKIRKAPRLLAAKPLKKKSNFNRAKSGRKKNFLIAPFLFLYHERSVCPLLLNYNQVYFGSSLIARPTLPSFFLKICGRSGRKKICSSLFVESQVETCDRRQRPLGQLAG